jgi:hypothetical protein
LATYPKVRVAEGQLTAAQVNANSRKGTNIVEPVAGKTITVVDGWLRAIGGNAAGATAVVVQDTTTSPNVAISDAVGNLTQNTVLRAGATGSTATNLGVQLGKGKGLRVGCTVSDLTTATHIDYMVLYKIDSD